MTLAGVYGFWKYVSNLDRRETRRYLEMFYALKYRDLVSIYATFEKLNYYVLLVMQIFMVCSSIFLLQAQSVPLAVDGESTANGTK